MRFLNYIATLLPSFTKHHVLESAAVTRTSLREHTLPAYEAAQTLWKGQKLRSEEALSLQKQYERQVATLSAQKTLFDSIAKALANGLVLMDHLSTVGKTLYADQEAQVSLTYTKATVLRLVQATEYANTYARRLLNYLYVFEAEKATGEKQTSLSPAELKWITEGFEDFCLCIRILLLDVKIVEKHLTQLPDATVTDLTEKTFLSTLGEGKLDPFQLRHLSARVNPFYLLGMYFAKQDAERYKAAKEELELLQLRHLQLQKLQDKKPDAKLEKEIDHLQNRVSNLRFRIEKMEKEYNV